MGQSNKLALKAGGWYVISNILTKGVAILSTPIITRLLSPGEFGISQTYISLYTVLTIISTLDIYSSVQIARYDFDDKEMDGFLSSILSVSSLSVAVIYLLVKISGDYAVDLMGIPAYLIDFMFLNILLANAFTILQTNHRAYMRYKEFVVLSITVAITSPLLSILLIYLQESDRYVGRIIGNALPKMIISLFIFIYIIKKGKTFYNKDYWKYALVISIPLIPHHLSTNLLSQFDRVMINKYSGATQVGLYSLAYSYSSILSVIWTSFNQAWTPWFYGRMKESDHETVLNAVKPYTIAFSFMFFSMLVVGPEAIRIFGPEEYWDGVWVIPPVLLGLFFQFIYSLYVNIEFYLKKTQYIAIGSIIAASLNVGLNLIAIPRFGYISAAYTTLIGYVFLFITHYFISNNWMKKDVIGRRFIFTWIAVISTLTLIITILYDYILLRYLFFIIVMSMMFGIYRARIVDLLKKLKKNKKSK